MMMLSYLRYTASRHKSQRNGVVTRGFTPVSLPLKFATFEFATNILGSLPIGKVQNLHLWRGKRKRTRNIEKYLVRLRKYFKWFTERK